tara:strand:+ start:211 stop:567 length:357 start_codon:yes stop_codon:yes gene_type:complete
MAVQYKHKRYFRVRGVDSSVRTFSSISDANTKIGFKSVFNTSLPTKSEALADSDQTLVVTYEFNSDSEQSAFKGAVDSSWGESTTPFSPEIDTDTVEHFKTEWLHKDGSVSATRYLNL